MQPMTINDSIPIGRNRADELMKSGRASEAVPVYRKWKELVSVCERAAAVQPVEALKPFPAGCRQRLIKSCQTFPIFCNVS